MFMSFRTTYAQPEKGLKIGKILFSLDLQKETEENEDKSRNNKNTFYQILDESTYWGRNKIKNLMREIADF